ncbi:ParB N-terminal domain-containing protein [bacterium]|nr:ParB N-terminal domain-containing protein [bacterium]
MAKNFNKAGSAETIKKVAKASAEKAQVIVIKMINNNNLHDCPSNFEDIKDTADLENSIKELGFTDPIEVTAFGQDEGEFMIVSGHRRRSAGVKCGMEVFPCIVKTFDNQSEVENYVLLANSQRDSAKDPLLFCKRYKMHEEYLKTVGFKGKIRDEVAKRLGISTPQADRYNTMNKVILPVWDMVRDDIVGMSSVLPMASHSEAEQADIYNIMQEALGKGITLTRDTVKQIVEGFRGGKKSWAEIAGLPRDSGLPLNGQINTEPGETKDPKEHDRNGEVRREFDPIAAEADKADADREAWERQDDEPQRKQPLTEDEKCDKRGKDIIKHLEKLNNYLSDIYTFSSQEDAEETLKNMASTFSVVVDEMYTISREYGLDKIFDVSLADMKKKVGEY